MTREVSVAAADGLALVLVAGVGAVFATGVGCFCSTAAAITGGSFRGVDSGTETMDTVSVVSRATPGSVDRPPASKSADVNITAPSFRVEARVTPIFDSSTPRRPPVTAPFVWRAVRDTTRGAATPRDALARTAMQNIVVNGRRV